MGVWDAVPQHVACPPLGVPFNSETSYSLTLRARVEVTTGQLVPVVVPIAGAHTGTGKHAPVVPFSCVVGMSAVARLPSQAPSPPPPDVAEMGTGAGAGAGAGAGNGSAEGAGENGSGATERERQGYAPGTEWADEALLCGFNPSEGDGGGGLASDVTDATVGALLQAVAASNAAAPPSHPPPAPAVSSTGAGLVPPAAALGPTSVLAPARVPFGASAGATAAGFGTTSTVATPAHAAPSRAVTPAGTPMSSAGPAARGATHSAGGAPPPATLRVWSVDLDAHWMVAAGDSKLVLVWRMRQCELKHRLVGHTEAVYSVRLLGGGRAASASGDETIRIWDLVSGRCDAVLREHDDMVMSLVFANDLLVSGSADATIRVWRISTALIAPRNRWGHANARSEFTLVGHSTTVYALALDPFVPLLVSGSHDGEVRLWNVHSGRCVGLMKPFGVPRPGANDLAVLNVCIVSDARQRCIVVCCRNGIVMSLDLLRRCTPVLTLQLGHGNARSATVVGGNRLVVGSSSGSLCIRRVMLSLP